MFSKPAYYGTAYSSFVICPIFKNMQCMTASHSLCLHAGTDLHGSNNSRNQLKILEFPSMTDKQGLKPRPIYSTTAMTYVRLRG